MCNDDESVKKGKRITTKNHSTMKMKLGIIWCYLLIMLINHKSSYFATAKSVDTPNLASCQEHVSEFFKSFLNITIEPSEKAGKCRCHDDNDDNYYVFIVIF